MFKSYFMSHIDFYPLFSTMVAAGAAGVLNFFILLMLRPDGAKEKFIKDSFYFAFCQDFKPSP